MVYEAHRSYVDLEDAVCGVNYCFTIDPSDRLQFIRLKGLNRLETFYDFWAKHLVKFLYGSLFKCYIEKSKRGRLHLHMQIMFNNNGEINDFYDYLIKIKDFCTYSFGSEKETVDDIVQDDGDVDGKEYPTWLKYIQKQFKFWKSLGFHSKIIHNEFKVLNKIDTNGKDVSDYFK